MARLYIISATPGWEGHGEDESIAKRSRTTVATVLGLQQAKWLTRELE